MNFMLNLAYEKSTFICDYTGILEAFYRHGKGFFYLAHLEQERFVSLFNFSPPVIFYVDYAKDLR
jgi:hypothetical protein